MVLASISHPSVIFHGYISAISRQAIDEMVLASISHPSIIFHGFFNEGPSYDKDACEGYEASASAVRAHAADIR